VPAATVTPSLETLFWAVAIKKYGTELTAEGMY
jgi:hypothetical protein